MRCTYCGARTHTIALCPKTWAGSARRANLRCTYCGSREHSIEACPKTFCGSAARAWHPETVADHFTRND
jgi:primosomal protein N'